MQCRSKIKKLRQEYKKIKDNNGLTGRGRSRWKYYDVLNELLGTHLATRPPVVVDTTGENPIIQEDIGELISEDVENDEEDLSRGSAQQSGSSSPLTG